MNQLVTNKTKKKMIMRQILRKRKPCLTMRAVFLALCALIFVVPTMAQQTNIYMKDGNRTIQRGDGVINFYDSHGPSQQTNYWETWYSHNENFTYVFKPAVNGDKIKVTFKPFAAWAEPADPNSSVGDPIGNWTLRLNDDVLTIYNGNGANDANIIAELTGNTQQGFSVMTDGPVTFKFVSNAQYREEGWYATVELVQGNMAPQVPLIQRSTCSDQAEIFSGTYNARIIYSIGDNDPAPGDPLAPPTYEYTGPISFPEETIPSTGFKVNAMSQLAEGGAWSSVTHAVFQESDRVPIPDADDELAHTTITREDGTNTIIMTPAGRPTGLNDTYEVRYTMSTNGTAPAEPTYNNSTLYTGPITATVNGTIFKAKTFAKSCHNQCSAESVSYVVNGIYAPAPVIDFNEMTITAAEGTTTFSILYTVDGTEPAISGSTLTGTFSEGTVDLSSLNPALTYGQTVKALAYMASDNNGTPDANYTPSQVVSAIYVPTDASGNTQNGVYGGIVLLDDREDHSWSYYSTGGDNNPIHSLTPADVKITYTGYGPNTMTTTNTNPNNIPNSAFNATVNANQVAVNVGEAGNQFIYLKTLENDDPEGEGNTYSYTMIPNPFQVRPAVSSGTVTTTTRYVRVTSITAGKKYLIVSQSNAGNAYALGHSGTTVSADAVTISSGGTANYIDASYVDPTSVWTANSGYTFQNGNYYIRHNNNNLGISTTNNNNSWTWNNNRLYYSSYPSYYLRYNNGWTISSNYGNGYNVYLFEETTESSVTGGDYRGFYAWRVKSLGGGLSITGKNVGDIIYPDETIEFVTANAEGNEVEFEALWAKAWVNASSTSERATNSGNYQNAYERNFKVGTTITTYDYPVTFSTLNPDGTGTLGTITIGQGGYSCSNDVKFENMTLSAANRTITAAGNDLIFGRGISGTVNYVRGISGNYTGNLQYNLRLESGTFNYVSLIKGYWTNTDNTTDAGNSVSELVGIKATVGSDYDRAVNETQGVNIVNHMIYGANNTLSSSNNTSRKTLDVIVKSGKIGSTFTMSNTHEGDAYQSLYMSVSNSQTNVGERYLLIEGGEISNVAGGIDNSNQGQNNNGVRSLTVRMKGGTVRGAFYGGAAQSPASGDRNMVFTGGTVKSWLGAGCNGISDDGGQTYGKSHLYVGGDTHVGGGTSVNGSQPGVVFGAGKGYAGGNGTSGEMTYGTTVVIADESVIENDVYGGGNYGYALLNTNVYVLGGTIQGNLYGGSNLKNGPVLNIYMKDGKVVGNIYGGSNTTGTITGLATINVSGGEVSNVFGGGYGGSTTNYPNGTIMSTGTNVTVTGGTISNNVYGGGEEGVVNGNTIVSFEGGSVNDIYGAGKGASGQNANVAQGTTVNVKGGVVNGSVYGGGENGTVAYNGTSYGSTVSVSGGEVKEDVFGGGKMGTTNGTTTVNISGTWDGTVIRGNVFAGAYGSHGSIYVAGLKTLNISGGRTYGSVYGGSRNANDANTLSATFEGSNETATTSVVNISGGRVDQHVYAAGYYGNSVGSVYAFIGLSAINDAPHHSKTTGFSYDKGSILIGGSVWAGGDWGVFSGNFGAPTITGNSNIYINGEGYSTDGNDQSAANYMNIQSSILGCGTSCDAGKGERVLILRNYGADVANSGADSDQNPYAYASRQVNSIQRFHNVIFDDAHLGFLGLGKINSLNNT